VGLLPAFRITSRCKTRVNIRCKSALDRLLRAAIVEMKRRNPRFGCRRIRIAEPAQYGRARKKKPILIN
jgi:hypothetical protein